MFGLKKTAEQLDLAVSVTLTRQPYCHSSTLLRACIGLEKGAQHLVLPYAVHKKRVCLQEASVYNSTNGSLATMSIVMQISNLFIANVNIGPGLQEALYLVEVQLSLGVDLGTIN